MPFYEYECSSCKFYSEVLQKISDKPLKKCPNCGKQTFKRLISAPVFRLKGSGWYETDFKSDQDKKRNLAGREEPAESKSEGAKSESKADAAKPAADAKPESKSEAKRESGTAKSSSAKSKAKKPVKAAAKSKKKSRR